MSADQVKAALNMILAVSETIREAGQVPSGTLYAALMSKVDLGGYNRIIDTLKGAGVIREENHCLIWIGPKAEASK